MTILFAGGELGSFTPFDNTVIETVGAGFGGYDPAYARCGITVPASPSNAKGFPFAATNAIWLHFNVGQLLINPLKTFLRVYSGATPIFQITVDTNGLYIMSYWNGAAFVQVGTGFSLPLANTQTFDIQLSAAAIFCYVRGTAKDGAAGAFANVTAMTSVEFDYLNDYMVFSEVIVSDQPTLGYRCLTLPATGNGGTQQWTGGVTDINEIVTNDGTFVASNAANQVELFTHATIIPSSIRAIVVTARATTTPAAPQNLQLACLSVATTNFSASVLQNAAFGPAIGVFPTDPNTGAAWTNAAAQAMQYGVKSLA